MFSFGFLKAQETNGTYQELDLTYKITKYMIDGVNYDDLAQKGDIALSFYMCESGVVCFANIWRNNNTQSYGGVSDFKVHEYSETEDRHACTKFTFTWHFLNTYDYDSGDAEVSMYNIYIGNSVMLLGEITVLKTNSILLFEGYLE